MSFENFKSEIQKHFKEMTKTATHLFEVEVDKDEMWKLYLDSFPAGTNKVFRERTEHDCSCCRHFIKNIGNAVVIKDNVVHSIWDLEINDTTYAPVAKALSEYIKSKAVTNVWISKYGSVGTDWNNESLNDGRIIKWNHLYIKLPEKFVDRSNRSEGDLQGSYRATRNVFKRSLDEISEESILVVLELISQNSLYKGDEWKDVLTKFLEYKRNYDVLTTAEEKSNYAWEHSVVVGEVIGRIRNHSMGTLLVDISEGIELDVAVRKYEAIVAPENYKRPKAIFTKKMLEEAKKTVSDLGYMESMERRFATLDDISINNIIFAHREAKKKMVGQSSGMNAFDDMEKEIAINPKKFSKVDEVSIDDFVKNIIPIADKLEVFLENKHAANMVSLIAPANKESATMFKWNNGFSWAYTGNITDSSMRENVKSAGGCVDGVLRFSIQWNDGEYNPNDFDAHCIEPKGTHIYYGNKRMVHPSSGMLDVDIINPDRNRPAVENIIYTHKNKMPTGIYQMYVHCYSNNGGKSGFKAEIELDGQIYEFTYNKSLRQGERINVANVMWDGNNFVISEKLPSSCSTKNIWNLTTNSFVPVSVVMYSPNYWDEQKGIGHKHYFFMLKECINSENPNGFYNEFLKEELLQHKRVFEALGSKMSVENVDDQLSGIGFSSTKRNDVLVKVIGASERVIRIKF
ncbi:MAG: hypothetical protein IJA34_00455 [Lachnospiraceae bacterium]|nr:hypothetical protein [Lachnospiraceae bacterium]